MSDSTETRHAADGSGASASDAPPLRPMPGFAAARRASAAVGRAAMRLTAAPRARLASGFGDWAAHPARMVWTLLISLALLSAVWPALHYARGFWLHGAQWGFLVNHQNDYGEGPLYNQEVIFYHLIFGGRLANDANAVPGGLDPYQLGEHPPFIVGNYPPVFPLVAALFMRVVGLTFMAGRLVSTLSILGAAILVGLIVWEGTGQILPGILGGGILITMSNGIWSWGPFNRVDSLALFWSMLTVFLVLRYAGTRKVWWAVPAAVLTVYCRQSMVDGVFAAFCFLLVRDWRRAIWVGLATLAAGLGVFIGLQIWTHGAFFLNTVVDNENAFNFGRAVSTWHGFVSGEGRFAFPLALAGAAAGLVGTGSVLWPIWLVGSVFVFATIGKTGAASNYYFTLEAATAACAGVFVGRLRTFFRRAPFPLWPLELLLPGMVFLYVHGSPPRWLPSRLPLVQQAMQLVGGSSLAYTPAARTSTQRYCQCWRQPANTAAVDYLQTVQGPVLAIDFPHGVVVQAGHEMQWQPFEYSVAYNDRTWNPTPFIEAIQDHYYAVVITKGGLGGYIGGLGGADISASLSNSYHYTQTVGGYRIYARNAPPSGPPPTVPEPVPHPFGELWHLLTHSATHPLAAVSGLPIIQRSPNAGAPSPAPLPRVVRRTPVHASTAAGGNCKAGTAVKVSGAFRLVCLAYDEQVFGVAGAAGPAPCFDQGGICLDPRDPVWPNKGNTGEAEVAGVPFWMPATGGGTKALLSAINFGPEAGPSVTVPVPAGKYGTLYFIGAAGNGPGVVDIAFHFAGGTSATATQHIDDWCAVQAGGGTVGTNAFLPRDRWQNGSPTGPACGVLEYSVRIPAPNKTLQQIVFSNDAANGGNFEPNILAITLR